MVKRDRRVRLATTQPSLSRLSRQCWILNILQLYGPSRPVTGIAVLFYTYIMFVPDRKHVRASTACYGDSITFYM
jgi:hypothetical protein